MLSCSWSKVAVAEIGKEIVGAPRPGRLVTNTLILDSDAILRSCVSVVCDTGYAIVDLKSMKNGDLLSGNMRLEQVEDCLLATPRTKQYNNPGNDTGDV